MADINSGHDAGDASGDQVQAEADQRRQPSRRPTHRDDSEAAEAELVRTVELLYFAYRDFTGEADAVLADFGFGRAHHRVLHFVNRRPGMRVADLLDILQITKQSLSRVLKQLVDRGFIAQEAGAVDRRERRLHLTKTGHELAKELSRSQTSRVRLALEAAGSPSGKAVEAFLLAMVAPDHRAEVGALTGAEAAAIGIEPAAPGTTNDGGGAGAQRLPQDRHAHAGSPEPDRRLRRRVEDEQ